MEKMNAVVAKIKKLTSSYEKNVDSIFKVVNDSNKSDHHCELQIAILCENLLTTLNYIFELKCIVLQLHYDLHNLKDKTEKDKLILKAYYAKELFEEQKSDFLKILQDMLDKRKKMKFTMEEAKAWHISERAIQSTIQRVRMMD